MDTAISLPQNLYFSIFCMPHTHIIYRCLCAMSPKAGRPIPMDTKQKQLSHHCNTGLAGSAVPHCFNTQESSSLQMLKCQGILQTKQVELQNMEWNKTSTSLWNTLWEDKICNYTLCKTNVIDHNRRNFHHSLQQSFKTEKSHHIALSGCLPVAPSIFSQCWSLFKVVHLTTQSYLAATCPWIAK